MQIGKLVEETEVGIVNANIPLLISKKKLKEWGGIIDFKNNTLHICKTDETIQLKETTSGHLIINVAKTVDEYKDEFIKEVFMIQQRKKYDMKSLKKLHRVFGHPSHEKLEILLKDAGEKDPIMLKIPKRIHTCCSICSKYKRKSCSSQSKRNK